MNLKGKISMLAATIAALFLIGTTSALAYQPPVEKYPKNWTWKQEKKKIYPNGSGRPKWMPKIWFAIAACEQPYGKGGVQWDAYSAGYEGGFGFAHSSWRGFKPKGAHYIAGKASTWEQYQAAKAIYAKYRFTGWGCWTGGGYKYHL